MNRENTNLHPSLVRQLRRVSIEPGNAPTAEQFDELLVRLNRLVTQSEETRYTLERSIDVSSEEMRLLYEDLKDTTNRLLKAEQGKLDSVIEALGHGVCAFSKTGEVLFSNKAAVALMGVVPETGAQVLESFSARSPRGEPVEPKDLVARALSGESLLEYPAQLRRSDGKLIEVSASLTPLSEKASEVIDGLAASDADQAAPALGVVLTFHDLTSRNDTLRNLASALKEANAAAEAKDQFLATVSHEIRTPLNGVTGMLELLLSGGGLSEQQQKFAEVARSSGDALLAIINDILDFSKLEADKVELDIVEFELQELLGDVAKVLTSKAQNNNTKISVVVEPGVSAQLLADKNRLRQVLVNLVANAVNFTANGEVEIGAQVVSQDASVAQVGSAAAVGNVAEDLSASRSRIKIYVSDTGVGIPASQINSLFEPFTQADPSTTRTHGGTGLGLSICKKLVQVMGGEIKVDSEEGVGSVFSFEIPVLQVTADSDEASAQPESVPPPSRKLSGLKVLVAEDNRTNQLVIQALLARLGHQCDIAENGNEVLDKLHNIRYDVILMDCMMPELDGYQTSEAIRALDSEARDIPIVALTANAMADSIEHCFEVGMDSYISKPVNLEELEKALEVCSVKLS